MLAARRFALAFPTSPPRRSKLAACVNAHRFEVRCLSSALVAPAFAVQRRCPLLLHGDYRPSARDLNGSRHRWQPSHGPLHPPPPSPSSLGAFGSRHDFPIVVTV